MLHFRRYLAALLVLSGLCGAYALAVAPLIEPPPVVRRPPTAAVEPAPTVDSTRPAWQSLFREGEWERHATKVKVIETAQATLLIQDYRPTPDGHLELAPCTIIFYAETRGPGQVPGSETAAGESQRRPIVLQAPAGAVLEFDQALDLSKAQLGRLQKGMLAGPITIFSPPTDATSNDALRITTRNVRLDRGRIFTQSEVEFRYGESHGRGSDLTIALLNETDDSAGRAKGSFGGVQSLTLEHLDRLHLAVAGQGPLGEVTKSSGPLSSKPIESLELTCAGAFTFDITIPRARFEDQVEVLSVTPGGPPDRLRCDQLVLEFSKKKSAAPSGETPPSSATPADGDPSVQTSLAGRLQRLVAIGSPVILEGPTKGIRATAAMLEYAPANRRITLKADDEKKPNRKVTQVSLQQQGQHFIASGIQYEMAEAGGLGRLWAAGPGELRLLPGRGVAQQAFVARWDRELIVRPDGKNQVISLQGAASIVADPLGRFDADELHIWVLEVPNEKSKSPRNEGLTDVKGIIAPSDAASQDAPARNTLVPDRLLANGNVRLNSPQLDVETACLKAWFINLPPAATSATLASAPQRTASLSTAAPTGQSPDPERSPSLQKFRVEGELIEMQLVVQGQKLDLEDLTIEGRALIEETRTPEAGQEPIRVAGKSLELRRGTTAQATIKVNGQLADLRGRGVTLSGETILVRRGDNQVQIDGPGEATLPVPDQSGGGGLALGSLGASAPNIRPISEPIAGHAAPRQQKMHVVWRDELKFDGTTLRLSGDVQCRTDTQLTRSRTLDVTLTQSIDFSAARGRQPPAEVARVRFDGGVLVKNSSLDERGQQISLDQMQVPNLTLDRITNTIHADGPGWIHTVRRGAAGLPGAAPALPAAPLAAQPGAQSLTSIHVAFEQGLQGDLGRRQIEFLGRVRTTYAPASDFNELIIPDKPTDLPPSGVLMTSERLTINDMVVPHAHWVELKANGNTHVEGRGFTIQAAEVRYTSDKEVLTIEGDGRADAQIWRHAAPGQAPDDLIFRKGMYNLRTGEFSGDGFKRINIQNLGAGLKFPLQGQKQNRLPAP